MTPPNGSTPEEAYAKGVRDGRNQTINYLNDRLSKGIRFDLLAQLISDSTRNDFSIPLSYKMTEET